MGRHETGPFIIGRGLPEQHAASRGARYLVKTPWANRVSPEVAPSVVS